MPKMSRKSVLYFFGTRRPGVRVVLLGPPKINDFRGAFLFFDSCGAEFEPPYAFNLYRRSPWSVSTVTMPSSSSCCKRDSARLRVVELVGIAAPGDVCFIIKPLLHDRVSRLFQNLQRLFIVRCFCQNIVGVVGGDGEDRNAVLGQKRGDFGEDPHQ